MNPNEMVTITNTKTKQVKRVKRAELANYGLPPDYKSQTDEYATGITKGGLTIDKVPEAYRGGVQMILNEAGYKPPDAKKKDDSYGATMNFINNLEKHYQGGGGASYGDGPQARLFGAGDAIKAMMGLNNEAQLYNKQKAGFAANLKDLTGDSGVLTNQDYERLAGLLPGFTSTRGEAQGAFNDLRSQMAAKYGGDVKETTVNPEVKSITDVLFPGTTGLVKNVQTKRQTLPPEELAKEAAAYSSNASPLQALLNLAGGQKQAQELVNPTLELTGAAAAPKALMGGLSFLKNVPGKVFPQKAGTEMRNEAINIATKTGVPIDGNKIMGGIEKWAVDAKKANPQALKSIDNFVEGAKTQFKDKQMTAEEVKDLWDKASKGYTAAGNKGASMLADYHRSVRDNVRGLLDEAAPGFEQGTGMIRTGLNRKKNAQRLGGTVGTAAATGISTALLFKLLGMGGGEGSGN